MKKNIGMIVFIVLLTIVVFSVGTYAYFTINFQDTRATVDKEKTTNLKTCELAEATTVSNVPDSVGNFTSTNIYPGHKEVASLSVTSNGELGATSTFNLVYNVTENTLLDNVSVSVYKTNTPISTTENYFECEKKSETVGGETRYFETCTEKDLGKKIMETKRRNRRNYFDNRYYLYFKRK